MTVRRVVAIDLARPPVGGTPVTIPGTASDPNALRAFLRRFSVQA